MFKFPITVAAGSLGQAAEEAYGIKVKAKHRDERFLTLHIPHCFRLRRDLPIQRFNFDACLME